MDTQTLFHRSLAMPALPETIFFHSRRESEQHFRSLVDELPGHVVDVRF